MWWLDDEEQKQGLIANYLDEKVQGAKDWFAQLITEWSFSLLSMVVDILSVIALMYILLFAGRLMFTSNADTRSQIYDSLAYYTIGLFVMRILATIFPIIAQAGGGQ